MQSRPLFLAGTFVAVTMLAACDGAVDPTTPVMAVPPIEVEGPAYIQVDPGAEVNTTITVADIACSETGAVTVDIEGIEPPSATVPLDVILVLDESGSITGGRNRHQTLSPEFAALLDAAQGFLDRMDAADGVVDQTLTHVRIGIIMFSGKHFQRFNPADYDVPLTDSYADVADFLATHDPRHGATNIVAALDLTEQKLIDDGLPGAAKAVLFLTDGEATQGETSPGGQIAAADAIKTLPARLFIVGIDGLGGVDAPLLEQMASPNSFVLLNNVDDLAGAFDDIATQALEFPAATSVAFTADVPAGFTLVSGSASSSTGTVNESGNTVTWDIGTLEEGTVSMTYQIQHDFAAEPSGGTLTAVTNAQTTGIRPISETAFTDDLADVDAEVTGCDTTPPEITPDVAGTLGDNDWYTSDVTVSWTVVDNESAITSQSGCDPSLVDTDTPGTDFTCTATSAGGTASVTEPVKRDATDPTVTYTGNLGSYALTDEVDITCEAADNLSGLASDSCADIGGPAWSFDLGSNSFSAEATDGAGNTGSGATSFEVVATFDGLCALVQVFVSQRGVANSLCAKVNAAERSADRGRTNAANGSLGAFINHVNAQTGKSISAEHAAILIAAAQALIT